MIQVLALNHMEGETETPFCLDHRFGRPKLFWHCIVLTPLYSIFQKVAALHRKVMVSSTSNKKNATKVDGKATVCGIPVNARVSDANPKADTPHPQSTETETSDSKPKAKPDKQQQNSQQNKKDYRKRNALYSRRNYYKSKASFEELRSTSYQLRVENQELVDENRRLQSLFVTAQTIVNILESNASIGGSTTSRQAQSVVTPAQQLGFQHSVSQAPLRVDSQGGNALEEQIRNLVSLLPEPLRVSRGLAQTSVSEQRVTRGETTSLADRPLDSEPNTWTTLQQLGQPSNPPQQQTMSAYTNISSPAISLGMHNQASPYIPGNSAAHLSGISQPQLGNTNPLADIIAALLVAPSSYEATAQRTQVHPVSQIGDSLVANFLAALQSQTSSQGIFSNPSMRDNNPVEGGRAQQVTQRPAAPHGNQEMLTYLLDRLDAKRQEDQSRPHR